MSSSPRWSRSLLRLAATSFVVSSVVAGTCRGQVLDPLELADVPAGLILWIDPPRLEIPASGFLAYSDRRTGDLVLRRDDAAIRVRAATLLSVGAESLARLATLANAEALRARPHREWEFRDDAVLGAHLRSPQSLLLDSGILERRALDSRRDSGVAAALASMLAALDELELSPSARACLSAHLGSLISGVASEGYPSVDLSRRMVAAGWLTRVAGEHPAAQRLEKSMTQALAIESDAVFDGPDDRYEECSDGFGRSIRRRSNHGVLTVASEQPTPHFEREGPQFEGVARYDANHPSGEQGWPDAFELRAFDRVLVSYDRVTGFAADSDAWRVATAPRDASPNILPDAFPPHFVVVAPDGHRVGLVTAHGRIDAPTAAADDHERFLSACAAALPDTRHLALVGECFVDYAADGPDSKSAELHGTPEIYGDRHQTPAETLALTCAGVARGDCDDLVELLAAILERQGRLARVLDLYDHHALATASERDDGSWIVDVLQTGAPYRFAAPSLVEALRETFREFSPMLAFDEDQIPMSLRFEGENTRSTFYLSHRMFSDAEYSARMIAVQREWHFHTYLRGMDLMARRWSTGAVDSADLREMAGLSLQVADHSEAARWRGMAIVSASEPSPWLQVERLEDLYRAGRRDEARMHLQHLVTVDWPKWALRLGGASFWPVAYRAARMVLLEARDLEVGVPLVADFFAGPAHTAIALLARRLDRPDFNEREFLADPMARAQREIAHEYVDLVNGILRLVPLEDPQHGAAVARFARNVESWVNAVALAEIESPMELLEAYARIGAFHRGLWGPALHAVLDALPPLTSLGPDRVYRLAASPGTQRSDLRHVRASTAFYAQELAALFSRTSPVLDRSEVARMLARLETAYATSLDLGRVDPVVEERLVLARFVAALVSGDVERFTLMVREIARRSDRALEDDGAAWIGMTARHFEDAWGRTVVRVWHDVVSAKHTAFAIAWTAAGWDAPAFAVVAAEAAARRWNDDPTFFDEARRLAERVQGAPRAGHRTPLDSPRDR